MLRLNRQIKAPQVRLIGKDGSQVGVVSIAQALKAAEEAELDLIEVVPTSRPPVCKVMDYGKFKYDQAKKEKESKKTQQQVKIKEVKVKPNIDDHDFNFKLRNARQFIGKGFKVRVTCMFRGRELAHPEVGEAVVKRMIEGLSDIGTQESPFKRIGRSITTVVAPGSKKKKE